MKIDLHARTTKSAALRVLRAAHALRSLPYFIVPGIRLATVKTAENREYSLLSTQELRIAVAESVPRPAD